MKNVLIYLNPNKRFSKEVSLLAKIQIDNSFDLGLEKDLLLVTNFPYKYNGIKALVIDEDYCAIKPRSTNTLTVPKLFDLGLIEENEVYWVHDFDAYQNEHFDIKLNKGVGLTTYGWSPKWCLGSFFFKDESRNFFECIKKEVYVQQIEDERALRFLTRSKILNRYEVLNITYNFGMRHVEDNWFNADKPLKVLHFHPYYKEVPTLDIFMYGKNKLNKPLMSERLIKIFHNHGVK